MSLRYNVALKYMYILLASHTSSLNLLMLYVGWKLIMSGERIGTSVITRNMSLWYGQWSWPPMPRVGQKHS